jgi:hypothetical protein
VSRVVGHQFRFRRQRQSRKIVWYSQGLHFFRRKAWSCRSPFLSPKVVGRDQSWQQVAQRASLLIPQNLTIDVGREGTV